MSLIDDNLPWVEKYRPRSLDDIISHNEIMKTLNTLIDQDKLPHLLFYGPPGTGKTTTILAVARKMYGSSFQSMVLELNASDDRGIDVVRNEIKTFASTRKIFSSGTKLIILDEADSMTSAAQAALRRVIEKYTKNARFCMICNYVNRIIPALQSRCTRFRFSPLDPEMVVERLNYIIKEESVNVTSNGLQALMSVGSGDMRKYLNVLQACSMSFGVVDEEAVYLCTGNPTPADMRSALEWMLNFDFTDAYRRLLELKTDRGIALADMITQIHMILLASDIPPPIKAMALERMSNIEYNLSVGGDEKIQLSGLVGVFQEARHMFGKGVGE